MQKGIPEQNNIAKISGVIANKPVFSHEAFGERFFSFGVNCKRTSGMLDTIQVLLSEHLFPVESLKEGQYVYTEGQFRSHNLMLENGRSQLRLVLFAAKFSTVDGSGKLTGPDFGEDFETPSFSEDVNEIVLDGFICKPPIYRLTPMKREIADVMLAVNRSYNKSDYIPCVSWGRNAKFCGRCAVGDRIVITGRIQSRSYQKTLPNGNVENRVAYEVSCSSFELLDSGSNDSQGFEQQ